MLASAACVSVKPITLVGKEPFKKNATYNASFLGAVNDVPVSKSWSFTTSI